MAHVSGGLAHEMNNPLSYVCSNVQFARERLQERGLLEADLDEALSDTEEGLARISQLVRQMQDFAPLIGEHFEYGCCADAVEGALARATSRLDVFAAVEKKVSTTCPRVALSQHRLVEVLHHLVANAANAASVEGHRGQARLWLTAQEEQPSQVRIVVEDSGPGLSAEAQARLFEPFFTTRPAGTANGLGLALCREHVERAGGRIQAENRAEGGARFFIVLPVAPLAT
jgi:C4-dicarboxylate-specific signal transduction histidine kinase